MIITLGTPKGGAGKTTCLLTAANGAILADPNIRIAIIDTDTAVQSLTSFMERRSEQFPKDKSMKLFRVNPDSARRSIADDLHRALDWGDLTLIDVQGVASRFNEDMVALSDVTIVPSRVGLTDFEPAAKYLQAFQKRADENGQDFKGRLLFTFMNGPSFLSTPERQLLAAIDKMPDLAPRFRTVIETRSIYKDAQDAGRLLREMDGKKSLEKATAESIALYSEICQVYSDDQNAPSTAADDTALEGADE